MNCKNKFCVFNRHPNNVCIKKVIELNECGCCIDFYYPQCIKGLPDSEKDKYFNPPKGIEGERYKIENKKYLQSKNIKKIDKFTL